MPRLGVLGWPVAHSRSPAMHNAALRALGLESWRYQKLPVPPELFEETVRALGGAGFVGANVTIPHKRAALVLADSASEAAREIGAANTLSIARDGGIAAENTDAPGLIAALGESPAGKRALVLGAGGSARAAVWALLRGGAGEVSVWNRTGERAEALARDLGARSVSAPEPADLLVNCTSVGLEGTPEAASATTPDYPASTPGEEAGEGREAAARTHENGASEGELERSASQDDALNQLGMTFDQVGEYAYVVDLVYRAGSTPLLAAARAHGTRTLDGVEVLAAQGALSLELWTGRPAPIDVMRRAARADDSG